MGYQYRCLSQHVRSPNPQALCGPTLWCRTGWCRDVPSRHCHRPCPHTSDLDKYPRRNGPTNGCKGLSWLSLMRGWPNSGAVNHRRMGTGVTPLVGASAADIPISCIMSSKQRWTWGNVRVESEMNCDGIFFRFLLEEPSASRCPMSAGAWFLPPFLLGQDLPLMCVRFAVGAVLLGQLKGWPSSLTLAAFRSEFLRRSYSSTSSVCLVARPFPEGEGDAQ